MSPDSGCNDPVSLHTRLRGKGRQGAAELPCHPLPACLLPCSCLPGHMLTPTGAKLVASRSLSRPGLSVPNVQLSCPVPLPSPEQGDG